MRSAELLVRGAAMAGLLALAGCASVGEPLAKLTQAAGLASPAAAASSPGAAAKVAAPATAASAVPAAIAMAEPDVAVAPETQRAFDEARRAMAAGRHDEAEKAFRALAQAHPELAGPQANLGILHRQAGKLVESAGALERAAQINPRRAAIFNQLGLTYRQQGQFAKARAAYERAIALDATYAAPVLNLGILHDLYLGDAARALELYGKYLALSPGGDGAVTKWVADIKNRKPPQPPAQAALAKKEQP